MANLKQFRSRLASFQSVPDEIRTQLPVGFTSLWERLDDIQSRIQQLQLPPSDARTNALFLLKKKKYTILKEAEVLAKHQQSVWKQLMEGLDLYAEELFENLVVLKFGGDREIMSLATQINYMVRQKLWTQKPWAV